MADVLKLALKWAKLNYPDSNNYRYSAFANSVNYLVTGWSGGYGGPSVREHLCSWSLVGDGDIDMVDTDSGSFTVLYPDGRLPRAGDWNFDNAIQFCKNICFGILPRLALKVVVQECCFDDDPNDLKQIYQWEIEELKELSLKRKKQKLVQKDWERLKFLREKHSNHQ
jgi:hypothetical protein